MKGSKIIRVSLGFLVGLAILGGLATALAGLLMLLWNVVGVVALSIAVSITFLTALKGVAILYGIFAVVGIIRAIIQSYTQRVRLKATAKMMRQFDEEMKKGQGTDFLKHFMMGRS